MVTIPIDLSKISSDGKEPLMIPINVEDLKEASKNLSQSNTIVTKSQAIPSLDKSLKAKGH